MFQIKICGITTPEDALLAAEAGANAIGLNFYEKSPRYVDPQRAAEIPRRLREEYPVEQIQVFAVFVNASLDDILWTIRDANLYGIEQGLGIQLHGDEPAELLRDLRSQGLGLTGNLFQAAGHVPVVPVVRALRCRDRDLTSHVNYLETCRSLGAMPQAVLLDAHAPGSYGGTGQVVDWTMIREQRDKLLGLPLILAGGLTPENVATAIATAHPDAVDVASGVESTLGRKDPAKVLAFVARAKAAFITLGR
jgi:phosphoribosylanthranilate isomerase